MSTSVKIILTIVMALCVLLSAFFSSCEIAYSSVNRIKLKKREEQGSAKATKALSIAENFSDALSTILVGNNLVNIAISSIGTLLAVNIWGEELGPTLSTLIVTVVVLIFGEIIPKAVANKYSVSLSIIYVPIYTFFKRLFLPITFVVIKFVNLIAHMWKPEKVEPSVTDEELIQIAEDLEEEGVIDEDDAELIISAIEFSDVTAHEIMVPRVDVVAIDIDDDQDEILKEKDLFRYSRVPVYEDTIDNVIGILNTTQLMKKILKGSEINIRKMLKEPLYVHKTKPISNILTEFKETNHHLAIVVDEFGGMMGILTMEDIVEELVGDIFDEMDEVVLDYKELEENIYEVDGDMNIYDFLELIEYDDRDFESEYTTVGGWCTDILERFPEVGDTFDFANVTVEITQIDRMRVEKAKVTVTIDETKEDDEEE